MSGNRSGVGGMRWWGFVRPQFGGEMKALATTLIMLMLSGESVAEIPPGFDRDLGRLPWFYDLVLKARVIDAKIDTLQGPLSCTVSTFLELEPIKWFWGDGNEPFWITCWSLPEDLRSLAAMYTAFPEYVDCGTVLTSDNFVDENPPAIGTEGIFYLWPEAGLGLHASPFYLEYRFPRLRSFSGIMTLVDGLYQCQDVVVPELELEGRLVEIAKKASVDSMIIDADVVVIAKLGDKDQVGGQPRALPIALTRSIAGQASAISMSTRPSLDDAASLRLWNELPFVFGREVVVVGVGSGSVRAKMVLGIHEGQIVLKSKEVKSERVSSQLRALPW